MIKSHFNTFEGGLYLGGAGGGGWLDIGCKFLFTGRRLKSWGGWGACKQQLRYFAVSVSLQMTLNAVNI